MVCTKNPTLRNVDEGGSKVLEKSKVKRLVSKSEGPKAKKRKDEAMREIAKWKSSSEGRKVICKRMVSTMEGSDVEVKEVVKILIDRGLSFFYKPNGSEKQPGLADIEFLHIMMSGVRFDVAKYMWDMIWKFRTVTSKRNMHFGKMITQLCIKAKVNLVVFDIMVPQKVGPITMGSDAKSQSMSCGATSSTSTQEPKSKDIKMRIDEWFWMLLCRQTEIVEK